MSQRTYRVVEFMTPFPRTVELNSPVRVAAEAMEKFRIRHLPVLECESLVGVVSDRDLRAPMALGRANHTKIKDVMTGRPFYVSRDARLDEVVARMAQERIGCAIVVDDDKPIGVFTTVDACRALWEVLQRDKVYTD